MGGDTSGLDKALKDTNREINTTQKELKEVERLLKLDPKNTELLAQKQELLGKQIEQTKNKVTALKDAQKNADNQIKNGVEVSQTQYRKLRREIASSEISVKNLSEEAENCKNKFESLGNTVSNVGKTIGKGLAVVGTTATAAIGGMVALEESTREYRTDLSKLETNTTQAGLNFEKMQDNLKSLVSITDETDSSIEALSNLMQTGFDDAGIEKALESLSGAVIAFPDTLKIESLADGLQETLATGKATGQFSELLERAGMNLDTFNAGLAEATKNGKQQEYILEQLANTGMAEVNKSYLEANQNLIEMKNAQFESNDAMSQLGEMLQPLITEITKLGTQILTHLLPVMQKIEGLIKWLLNNKEAVLAVLAGIVAGIAAFNMVTMIQNMVKAFQAWKVATEGMTIAQQLLNLVMNANPIGLVVSAVAALTAGLVVLWNTNDGFKEALIGAWEGVKNAAANVWKWIVNLFTVDIPNAFNTVLEFVQNNWQSILLFLVNPIAGAVKMLYDLNPKFKEWVDNLITKIKEWFGKMKDIGKNIIEGLWEGIKNAKDWLINKIKQLCNDALGAIKSFFGIESPSKLMRDEVGKYMAEGIGVGFNKQMPSVIEAMKEKLATVTDALNTELNFGDIPQVQGNKIISENSYVTKNYTHTVETIRQPSNIELNLNGVKFARAIIPSLNDEYVRMGARV